MILVTVQFELGGKTLYDQLDEHETTAVKDAVTRALTGLGAEVAVVDVEDDGF